MQTYKFEGKTLEQALNLALYELNVNETDIVYTESEEKAGLLKGKKIVIQCIKLADIAEFAKEALKDLLKNMNVKNSNIEMKLKDSIITLKIHSENNSIIIGKKGHILDAIQTYIKQAVNVKTDNFVKIIVDVENYKEKQVYFLQKDAKKVAREVLRTKGKVELDPMTSYERKIVHDALSTFKNIKSDSEGTEPNRRIVIEYIKEPKDS